MWVWEQSWRVTTLVKIDPSRAADHKLRGEVTVDVIVGIDFVLIPTLVISSSWKEGRRRYNKRN